MQKTEILSEKPCNLVWKPLFLLHNKKKHLTFAADKNSIRH